jgi:hypothetical protein
MPKPALFPPRLAPRFQLRAQLLPAFEIAYAHIPSVVRQRDEWAAQYIASHKEGKVIVIGGKNHSGHYRKEDTWQADGVTAMLGEDNQGLDRRLGYPSIDFTLATDVGEIGATGKDGTFSDYRVRLPADLAATVKELGIASWPPMAPAPAPPLLSARDGATPIPSSTLPPVGPATRRSR